jgi:hypothetical protein
MASFEPLEERLFLTATQAGQQDLQDALAAPLGDTQPGQPLAGTSPIETLLSSADQSLIPTSALPHGESPNDPIGEAKGIFPGRVVWVRDPNATSGEVTSYYGPGFWWDASHTSQTVVESMLSKGLRGLSGQSASDAAAWNALFKSYNSTHNRGNVGYAPGEKIAIKLNLNNEVSYTEQTNQKCVTPQLVLALLKQLVNVAGVPQENIVLYDSIQHIEDKIYNPCHALFPNVVFADGFGGSGRTLAAPTANSVIYYWNGTSDKVPQVVYDATYLINFGVLSKHSAAGVTLCGKNHFGSLTRTPNNQPPFTSTGPDLHNMTLPTTMGQPNAWVDFMGSQYLGGKTFLYMLDGLWGGWDWGNQASMPKKWTTLGNDWPSSLFLSQDPVAIDSVGLDFLTGEDSSITGTFPATDNYLHEAALANAPLSGIRYDPDNPSQTTRLASLGVHEHWDSATDRKYTRNLGTGSGIELFSIQTDSTGPTPPTNLSALVVSDTQINLTWNASTDTESSIVGYRVYRNGTSVATPTTTSYNDTGLTQNTTYSYKVSAVNGNEVEGSQSSPQSATTMPSSETWTGGGADDHWENAANWSLSIVPGAATVVVLDEAVTSNQPVLYQDQAAKGLDIRTAGWTVSLGFHNLILGSDGLSIAGGASPTSKVDMMSGNLIVDYADGAASPYAQIRDLIKVGRGTKDSYGASKWDGLGITSSTAQAGYLLNAIGVLDNGFLAPGYKKTDLEGILVDDTTVMVKYTYNGDANLDGVVDRNDLNVFITNYLVPPGASQMGWQAADFNDDGAVDRNDLNLFMYGYLRQGLPLGEASGVTALAATSEPAPAPASPAPAAPASTTTASQILSAGGLAAIPGSGATGTSALSGASQPSATSADLDVRPPQSGNEDASGDAVLEVQAPSADP